MNMNMVEIKVKDQSVIKTRPLYQWDSGQILKVTDQEIPDNTEVQFGSACLQPSVPAFMVGNQVKIPQAAMEQAMEITAYMVIVEPDSETTVKEIRIPIKPKPKAADYVPEEEEPSIMQVVQGKANKSGWTPNKYLGTDAEGNIVEKDAAGGGGGIGDDIVNQIEKNTADIEKLQNEAAKKTDIPTTLPASDVHEWAKQPEKPQYTAEEVGALPSTYTPPNQTAEQVGADPAGAAADAVATHNAAGDSHNDIRLLIEGLNTRLNTLANSTDTELDQMAELVAYIKDNRGLIEQITTGKVSVTDIINNLTTNVANKPLSAAQGVVLKGLIDTLQTSLTSHTGNGTVHITDDERTTWNNKANKATTLAGYGITDGATKSEVNQLAGEIADQQAQIDAKQPKGNYLTAETDPTVPSWAKQSNKPTYTASEVGAEPANAVSGHNVAADAHNDIRLLITGLTTRLNTLANSTDTELDQMAELVTYIKDNRELIEQITTGKVSVTDIINNLTTNVSNKPLSAAQGVALKGLIDALQTSLNSHTGNSTVHITAAERTKWNQAVTDVGNLSEEIADQNAQIADKATTNYVDTKASALASDIETNAKAIVDIKAELEEMNSTKAEGNTLEEQLAWLAENGDKTKEYLLIDGYYYKCEVRTTEGETVPNFTNVLDTATKAFNQRYSSSDALKAADGILALDYISVKVNDVVRFSKASVLNGAASGYQRVKYYNASKTSLYNNDIQAHKVLKITTDSEGVASYVVGYINTTSGNDATNALISGSANIAYTRLNLYLGSAAITEADIADLIMTINEPIEYTTTEGKTEYVWVKSGTSSSANYGEAITALEETTANHETRIKSLESESTSGMTVFAPSPQLPADGGTDADFNAETITCKNIYDYIDALVAKYPKFLTKETLGKDQSGEFDWNRYTCCRRYYEAWQKPNYPKMYGWVNGSTTIYSVSVSPRIGDTLYTTAYIGTAKGTVSAVDNANQTRTVGGVVYTRDKTKDIEPTLIYSVMLTCKVGNSVYNSAKVKVTTISSITSTELVGADGVTYTRYPLGDRNADFVKPEVIVIGSNEHGRPLDPAEPAIISARMIKDLCECVNANNPFLNMLKNNYMVVFLPIINPWGYDNTHKSYYNSRGVNLDRNLDTPGWGGDTSNPQGEYGGSEAEMQYFMNTLVESGAKIVTANHALGTQTNSTGEGANSGRCHYMLGRNNSKYDADLLAIAECMLANYNLFFTDYGQAPPETYAKTRSYIDWIGAEGGAVEMQAREGYVLDGNAQLHTARILEADYTLHLQFLYMLIKNAV